MAVTRWSRVRRKTVVGMRLAAASALLGLVVGVPAAQAVQPATPWSGSGPGTATVDSDGTSTLPSFSYSMNPAGFSVQTWQFTTVADATGPVELTYDYSGFHAYAAVTAFLNTVVTHGGATTTNTVLAEGPQSCCTSPSNGFRYTGTVTLDVAAGDTYGFAFGGSNFDSTNVLSGTLTVGRAQSITFPQPADLSVGQPDATLEATAGSGLDVAYVSATPAVCTVDGDSVHAVSPGTCTIEADQAGDNLYSPATQVSRSFTVAAPVVASVDVTLDPASIVADGSSTSTVTVTVEDPFGNPMPGEEITFSSTDDDQVFGQVTDEGDGSYTTTVVSSTTVHRVTITAGAGQVTGSATLTQTAVPGTSTPTATPTTTPTDTDGSTPTSGSTPTEGAPSVTAGELANTGFEGGTLAGAGLGLLAAGALLVVVSRRPRRQGLFR